MKPFRLHLLALALSALAAATAHGQQSERFGPYELHYSVVNTTFLQPEVAAGYGITRGKKRAILNLAVRELTDEGSEPRSMQLQGRTRDLIHAQDLEFQEVREGAAIYYIAEFSFINEEWRFFEVDFRPQGSSESYRFEYKHQLYIN
ncbi:DUF4426 domain-containing protein [Kineobactrum salinum]|uniref:DUF4426 domain-containing protein n=1 Tax=Kineobactrum salinum TaxID=2708301 RepID=A0A6C0U7S5_9GAMM|nr:DUF4426 domain-containing protein [Kineobactrum salinum]QIB65534.1 DUF4426 domain-containing protein [Kineobactrum salinum]